MQIKVNGKAHTLENGLSVQALTEALGLNTSQIAVEKNGEIVSRSRWAEVAVSDGDAIEIVRFVGGG
jgi:sulfur carrier protein